MPMDCRSTNDAGTADQDKLSAGASLVRLDAPESELFTILDLGDSHQRRASRSSAECYPHRRRNEEDSTAAIGMNSRTSVE